MAAIRCAGAGRALLHRAPGILRRTAGVSEGGVLQYRIAPLSLSSNRYMSSYDFEAPTKKKLAVALMKEGRADKELDNVNEMLRLINSTMDSNPFTFVDFKTWAMSDSCRQHVAARSAIEEKKLELVSDLLQPGGGQEYKKKVEEFAVALRLHRGSLLAEDLKARCEALEELQYKMIVGTVLWGIPMTIAAGTEPGFCHEGGEEDNDFFFSMLA